ncbi:hypothetical protein PPACK8108_LOCUS2128 [Phakopsora pachyrhizi]|uniref:Uncharacterized protein n=1 Tax=Phakopsora pachyrhizi TaxID=170000 RepID=A0AAV0AIS9_PHAPC|nr:hypothetical protein PPACK8108_LOCUS2128 [Phakopsora pachyrhizi]
MLEFWMLQARQAVTADRSVGRQAHAGAEGRQVGRQVGTAGRQSQQVSTAGRQAGQRAGRWAGRAGRQLKFGESGKLNENCTMITTRSFQELNSQFQVVQLIPQEV